MIHDAAVPPGISPTPTAAEQRQVCYSAARWTPQELEVLADTLLRHGSGALAEISDDRLLAAWSNTVEVFLDPGSQLRGALDPMLTRLCGLSSAGLSAALETVLGGVTAGPAAALLEQRSGRAGSDAPASLVVVILASNLPALAVQPLLPALLLRHPILLKSASSEPLFAPAFVRTLVDRLPELATAVAAITWKGGDRALEDPLLDAATQVLAYGDEASLAELRPRIAHRLFEYGPRTSLAVVADSPDLERTAAGLARDIALFDQRGCLSVQAIFTSVDAQALMQALAVALGRVFETLPPGQIDAVAAAGVQQIRSEAAMRGLPCSQLPLATGTVVVEPEARFRPSPGLRTVRIHPLKRLDRLPSILAEWSGRLQGAALEGEAAWRLEEALAALGVSRFAAPGELQRPDAGWHNGGIHPLDVLAGAGPTIT